ncbi:MAG: T9SS type A sorting domain-containing protein [Spirochaetes bacterium]|nr:T9SS type A sorting domain-containing protein [Spirochaetota bacterium]
MKKLILFIFILLFIMSQSAHAFDYVTNKNFIPYTPISQPAKGASITDPDFNTTFYRVADATADGVNDTMATIVYSRWSPLNSSQDYLYLQRSTGNPDALIYSAQDYSLIKILPDRITIDGVPDQFFISMESAEIRWDNTGNHPNRFYFVNDTKFYQYDLLTDTAQLIHDFKNDFPTASKIQNDVEGDSSTNSRYWAWMVKGPYDGSHFPTLAVITYDKETDQILGVMDLAKYQANGGSYGYLPTPNMVEISPSGKKVVLLTGRCWGDAGYGSRYLDIGTSFDGPHAWDLDFTDPVKVSIDETHSGWAWDYNGNEMFVSQNNRQDWIEARNIQTGEIKQILYHGDLGWNNGMHFARMPSNVKGWVLMSTYNSGANSDWGDNQLIMLEIKDHTENPRVWRLGHMHNNYDEYYAEGFAAMSQFGDKLWWGAKWPGQNNIEAYEMVLPPNWQEELAGGSVPVAVIPDLHHPVNETIATNSPNFIWSDESIQGAIKYWLQVSASPAFSPNLVDNATITGTNFLTGSPLADGNYYWRVQAETTTGWQGWSPSAQFSIAPVSTNTNSIFSDDFSTDKGWTGYGTDAQWQRGPAVTGGGEYGSPDPASDHSPGSDNNVAGNNIGGDYINSIGTTCWLTSPIIDCSEYINVTFSFWKYLNIEGPSYDHAYIAVYNGSAWIVVWENTAEINSSTWENQIIDVSAYADNNANFQIRFGLGTTDTGWRYSGWNLDDLILSGDHVTSPTLPAVTLNSPINGIWTNNNRPLFNWNDVTGAERYNIQIAGDAGFTSPQVNTTNIISEYNPSSPLPEGTNYWRVRAHSDSAGFGPYSEVRMVRIDTAPPSQVTLTLPADGSIIHDTKPLFTWNPANDLLSGVSNYRIQIDTESNFNLPIDHSDISEGTSYTTPSDLGDGTYYWRVQTCDRAENSGIFSEIYSLTIITNTNHIIPAPLYPVSIVVNTDSPVITWSDETAQGAGKYWLQISDISNFASLSVNESNCIATNYSVGTGLSDGTYYWRIQAHTLLGWQGWSKTVQFSVDTNKPCIQLVYPVGDLYINEKNPAFCWIKHVKASRYHIQISISDTFITLAEQNSNIVQTNFVPGVELSEKKYHWRIRGYNQLSGEWGDWTKDTFQIDLDGPQFSLLQNIISTSPGQDATIKWNSVSDTGSGFAKFSVINNGEERDIGLQTWHTIKYELTGEYLLSIRAYDELGNYTEKDVTIKVVSALPEGEVKVYPNPVSRNSTLTFEYGYNTGKNVSKIKLYVYDIMGNIVLKRSYHHEDGKIKWDLKTGGSSLTTTSPGLYIYKVVVQYSDGSSKTSEYKKMVIKK